MNKALLLIPTVAIFLHACSTSVDVGENGRKRDLGNSSSENDPNNPELNVAKPGSCFGAADKLPENFELFCNELPEADKKQFANLYDTICLQKIGVNLVHPDCGWNGKGSIAKHIRVLKTTPNDDPNPGYYYYVAYSVTTQPNERNYVDTIFFALSQPAEFAKKYLVPVDTVVTPSAAGITNIDGRKTLNYNVKLSAEVANTQIVTKFDAMMQAVAFGSSEKGKKPMNVVLDHMIPGSSEEISLRNHITFSQKLTDGRGKIIVLEERRLPKISNAGFRELGGQKLLNLDKDKMRILHENALRN